MHTCRSATARAGGATQTSRRAEECLASSACMPQHRCHHLHPPYLLLTAECPGVWIRTFQDHCALCQAITQVWPCCLQQQRWGITGHALTCIAHVGHAVLYSTACLICRTRCSIDLVTGCTVFAALSCHKMVAMLHSSAPTCNCRQRTADLRKGMGTAGLTVKQSRRHTSARGVLLFDVCF